MEVLTIKGKRTKRQRTSHRRHNQTNLVCFSGELSGEASSSSSDETLGIGNFKFSSEEEAITTTEEEEDLANCLILLARSGSVSGEDSPGNLAGKENLSFDSKTCERVFPSFYECKTCERVFSSFQALGGHRASHKKTKSDNKATPFRFVDEITGTALTLPRDSPPRKGILGISHKSNGNGKVHECSVCGAEFTSGQALGGHMRRHRTTTSTMSFQNQTTMNLANTTSFSSASSSDRQRNVLELDLNLPAPESTANFPSVIVFSATTLVDCHY